MTSRQDDLNLTDPEFFATGDPHQLFKRMRTEDPVHWTQGRLKHGFWSLFRHEDAYTVYRGASEIYANGIRSVGLPSSPEVEAAVTPEMLGCGKLLVATDGEFHRGLRKALNAPFLPRAMKRYEESGRRLTGEIFDQILPRGECEFVAEVAARLPMAITWDMMEIPRKDWQMLYDMVNQVLGPDDPEYHGDASAGETAANAWQSAAEYCAQLGMERRGCQGDDFLTLIANARVLGRELTPEQVGYNVWNFVIGGLDTTRNAISGGLLAFIQNPDQMRRLRDEPSLMPTAVEEILRWTSPITHSMRVAVKDTEIAGRKVKVGDWVVVWNASANRDELAFAEPDRFDVGRSPNEHFAFAYGEHFCIGAHLARLEIRLIFEEMMARMPDPELAGEVERVTSIVLAGIKRLPIRFAPRRAAAA
ncbi:MAG TPA: cytochrome P450 [Candidatus Binataceae bacterium]|nr:cytochrome P450 [Candidatus Binataceae bacterium]